MGEHMRHPLAENLGNQDSHAQSKGETKQNLLRPLIQEYSKKNQIVASGHLKNVLI